MAVNSVRRNGSYAPLSAHYYKDDAIDEAGLDAELLYVRGLAFCADILSDGFISDRQLVRFVGVGMDDAPERAKRLVAADLWERTDGGYRVRSWLGWNRSREEITQRQAKDAERKAKGREGADSEPPDDGPPDNSGRSPNGVRAESDDPSERVQSDSSPRARAPLHSTPRNNRTTSATADAVTKPSDDGFAAFWAAYPRKVKKQDAMKAWSQVLRRKVEPERVTAAAKAHADRWRAQGKETEFVPYPASWLRGGSYDDELEPARLSVVPERPTDPDAVLADLYSRADAKSAADLIGIAWVDPAQRPSDPTPYPQWSRARRLDFIDEHREAICAALTARRTG